MRPLDGPTPWALAGPQKLLVSTHRIISNVHSATLLVHSETHQGCLVVDGMAMGFVSVPSNSGRPGGKSMRTPVDLSKFAKPAASARYHELLPKYGEEGPS